MATGTGNLPNQDMEFNPFDPLPASQLNDLVENTESLADGTGIGDGSVTPEKRSGGFYIGTIPGATLGTTGNKAITGVGFTPRLVEFTPLTSGAGAAQFSLGAMTASSQFVSAFTISGASAVYNRQNSTSNTLGMANTTTGWGVLASYVSMDADGFTINVTTASSSFAFAFKAYA